MYQKNYRPYRQYSQNRGYGGGGRRIKTFDPSFLVQKTSKIEEDVAYIAKNTFADFALDGRLLKNILARGYKTPTPIQDQAISELSSGRDIIGIADTGTGKTAAFLIPLINKALKDKNERVLVIVPTRELADQIDKEFRIFSGNLGIYSAVVVGGMSIYHQSRDLSRGPQFVIGTPGRLKDMENRRMINYASFGTIVLDEVDRMLDMGFVNEIREITMKLPTVRQSLFFSATTNSNVQRVMAGFVKNPVIISIKSRNVLTNINQEIVRVNGTPKLELLCNMLAKEDFHKVLVFGRTKRNVEKLARELNGKGIRASSIHGNKSQNQRYRALDEFKYGKSQVLIATDVASRGIDVDDITHVINYDLPESEEVYIHRIGRTGRANKVGHAVTFID